MKILTTLNKVNFRLLNSKLRKAEIARNFEDMKALFSVVWTEFEHEPKLEDCSFDEGAEFTRLAGVFLILYGKAKNLPSYQLRGKDLLSKAIDYFFELNELEKAIESKILIATGYYQEGAVEEKQAILEDALSYFEKEPEHPLALLVHVNLLIVEIKKDQLERAMKRMGEIIGLITTSPDNKLKTQFYTQRGVIFRLRKDYTESIASYTLALEFAKKIPNLQFEALIKNSLAMTYLDDQNLDLAMRFVDKAIELLSDEIGWRANFYDTKANIYLALKDFDNAILYAEHSVSILAKGEDYGSYAESLWTKVQALIQLNFQTEAIETFTELYKISLKWISEQTADSYLQKFNGMIYLIPQGDYFEKVALYKKHLVIESLIKHPNKKIDAARNLGIKRQTLDDILDNQFPELLEDFELFKRKRSH